MDIVKNVRRQTVEIEKILRDIRAMQKEINAASQTLQRAATTRAHLPQRHQGRRVEALLQGPRLHA